MAINFNNQNQNGIGNLDLSQFGLMQPQNQNMQVADAYNTPTEGEYGFNLIELDKLKNAGYDPAELSTYPNQEDVQSIIRNLEPTSMSISNYDQLFGPKTMSDANQSLYTGVMDRSGTPIGEDIDMGYTDNSFNTQPRQGILQGLQDKIGAGFNNVKDFAMDKGRMGRNLLGSAGAMALGLPGIVGSGAMALMGGMGNQFADKTLYGDTIDENGNVYSADQLNKMNAAGGGYTDPARSARRRTSRISKMRARDFNNKKISQTNLNRLVRQEKAQQAARESATAARAMARNPQVYANAGITSGGFASQNTGSNSNFSNKSGRGRTGYQEGGLASMFTRRR